MKHRLFPSLLACASLVLNARQSSAQIVISGNELKIDLTSGAPKVVKPAAPDSLSIVDFSSSPPTVKHLHGIPNTVVGPPSNIAIAPDGRLALIADSIAIDSTDATKWVPARRIHILDLTLAEPRIIGEVEAGLQPSGISFSPDGRLALVANRGGGTVTVLAVDGRRVARAAELKICEPAESVSDVAIAPDGKSALASVQKGGYLARLAIDGQRVTLTSQKISTYGQPYRCVITPDGEFALTAGAGFGNGFDQDAVTVIDLKTSPIRAVDYIPVGVVPESLEISPDGKLLAVVTMDGSNLPESDPNHAKQAGLVLLKREGRTFKISQRFKIGRIPEGVAFTPDGRYLIAQCHPDRVLWVFAVRNGQARETGRRISLPGWGAAMRAGMKAKP